MFRCKARVIMRHESYLLYAAVKHDKSRRSRRRPGEGRDLRFSTACYSICSATGFTCHIFSQYSRIARSEENFPMRATLRIDMRVQRS